MSIEVRWEFFVEKKKSLGYGEKNATSVELIFFLMVNSSPSSSTYSLWLRIR